jgi:hypothetical protein
VEKLKRQLRRELVGVMRPILEAQRIQCPNIGGVMSEKSVGAALPLQLGGG